MFQVQIINIPFYQPLWTPFFWVSPLQSKFVSAKGSCGRCHIATSAGRFPFRCRADFLVLLHLGNCGGVALWSLVRDETTVDDTVIQSLCWPNKSGPQRCAHSDVVCLKDWLMSSFFSEADNSHSDAIFLAQATHSEATKHKICKMVLWLHEPI